MSQPEDKMPDTLMMMVSKAGIQTIQQRNVQRFDEWMRNMNNVHYADSRQMSNAYMRIE